MTHAYGAGLQQQLYCGIPFPYQTSANRFLNNNNDLPRRAHGEGGATPLRWTAEDKVFFKAFQIKMAEMMWGKAHANNVFVAQSKAMYEKLNPQLRVGNTGYEILLSGTNLDTTRHKDAKNMKGSWQAVLIRGSLGAVDGPTLEEMFIGATPTHRRRQQKK